MTMIRKKWPTKSDLDALDVETAKIEDRKQKIRALMGERFLMLVEGSGLMGVDISDDVLMGEFRAIAVKFRQGKAAQPAGAIAAKA